MKFGGLLHEDKQEMRRARVSRYIAEHQGCTDRDIYYNLKGISVDSLTGYFSRHRCNATLLRAFSFMMMLTVAKRSTFTSAAGAGNDAPQCPAGLHPALAAWTDAALQAFIAQHDSRIYGLARAILKNPDWADDALQDTYLRVLQQPPPETNQDTWVLKIARNVCLDICRRRKVRGELDAVSEPVMDDSGATDDSPLDAAIAQEDLATLTRAIDLLPAGLREILVLRFFHNLEPADIGQVLNISGGNARIRLFRAIRELKRALTDDGPQPGRTV